MELSPPPSAPGHPGSATPGTTIYSPDSYTTAERPLHMRYRKRRYPPSPVSFELPIGHDGDAEDRRSPRKDGAESILEQASLAAQPASTPSSPTAPSGLAGKRFSLITSKKEPEDYSDAAEQAYEEFGTLLASALQGDTSYADLGQLYEGCCRRLSEAVGEDAERRQQATEEHVLRQTASLLHAEAATWSLLWHLLGKPDDSMEDEQMLLLPSPSQQDACDFVTRDELAQRCMRVVQWLEGLASLGLTQQLERKGGYVGVYSHRYGVWHQTQRSIRIGKMGALKHVDPDAPTREQGRLHPEDENFEAGLMEDIWRLLRAGRLEEARQLCRSAGQAWRSASLGGCGDEGPVPTPSAWTRAGRGREAQALEMESERGRQRRLWKWACFCASEKMAEKRNGSKHEAAIYAAMCSNVQRMLPVCSDWESACWALVRSWLDAQVDGHLARLHGQRGGSLARGQGSGEGAVAEALAATAVPYGWPRSVQEQQPANMEALLQKLQASEQVHETVRRSCKEPHRRLQMRLMLMDVGQLLESLRAWVTPPPDASTRPPAQAHMMRFGAHLVLLLRLLLPAEEQREVQERLRHTGDAIIYTYAILLLAQQREELVALYAAQLAPYLREDLYVHLLDLRQNASSEVKQRILASALQHLPLEGQGSIMAILDRAVQESRALRPGPGGEGWRAHARAEGLRRVRAVQWLCCPCPPQLPQARLVQGELWARALLFSNVLLREFALAGLGRHRKPAVEALELLGGLSAPGMAQLEADPSLPGSALVHHGRQEFDCWREYFACDALYRQWVEAAASEGASGEEHSRALWTAQRALAAVQTAIQRAGATWLPEDIPQNAVEPPERLLLRLSGVVGRGGEGGSTLQPDPAACALLASALQAAGEPKRAASRHFQVEVRIHPLDSSQVEVTLGCQPSEDDGIGPSADPSGGLLAAAAALAIKGELPPLPEGVALLPLQVEGYALRGDQRLPASSLVRGLCRRCCIPELVLRCMQLRVYVAAGEGLPAGDDSEVVQRVVAPSTGLHPLFTPRQLQDVLQMEREALVLGMAARERRVE